jgi:hypothetical protein
MTTTRVGCCWQRYSTSLTARASYTWKPCSLRSSLRPGSSRVKSLPRLRRDDLGRQDGSPIPGPPYLSALRGGSVAVGRLDSNLPDCRPQQNFRRMVVRCRRPDMDKSFRVFLSSTFTDLTEERKSVLEAIRRLQLRHDSMEFFGASTKLPINTCLEEVRKSDVLVVLVGHRYGNLVPERGISFSEAEYKEGHRLRKPCLVYFRNDNVPVLSKRQHCSA